MDKKITGGTGNGKFSPSQTCTQSQILTFLWNAQGSPEPEGTAALTGLDPEKFYYKASLWAVEQGLLEAEDCRPDEPCTRTMVVTYLWSSPAVLTPPPPLPTCSPGTITLPPCLGPRAEYRRRQRQ